MPPNDNVNTQNGKNGTGNSGEGSKNHKDDKVDREEQLNAKIKKIWKEVREDVDHLSKRPLDKDIRNEWKDARAFKHWHWGKNKGEKQAQGKKDDEPTEKIEDPTKEVLKIMEDVTPDLTANGSKAHERFRAAVTTTIQCIITLGKTAAGAASQVFAPAPSCFDAISFFLQFWLNYIDMLEKLEELLAKCNDFIGRLHIYDFANSTKIDIELQYIAAKLMGKLVKVLRFSVDIQLKGHIWAKLGKQSFLGNSEIDKLISEMSSLVEDEHRLLATLSYKDITNIRQVMAQQQVAADVKSWRMVISKALGFANDEPKRLWQNKFEEINNSLISNTGNWVTNTQEFKEWVALPDNPSVRPSDGKAFLVIKGAENSGKSYLMANIVNHLYQIRSNHAIAYYFHDRGADRQMDRIRTRSLVLKCLLWQCATSLSVLIKSMAEKCQYIGHNPNVDDMWRQLFLQNTRIHGMKAHFYILVDGVEDGVKDVLQVLKMLVKEYPETFRILIATRDRGLSLSSYTRLDLSSDMQVKANEDIDLHIQHYLNNMPAFEESTHPKATEYRKRIAKTIREKTKGDFAWMTIVFERLHSKHHLADIDKILNDMNKRPKDQIRDEIERLNRSLSPEEIKEINEVILWVLKSQVTPTLDDMSAVLSLSSHTESLMPLRRRLNPLLQANESDRIEFRLSEIKEQIPEKPNLSTSPSSVEAQSLLGTPSSSQLVEAEVETVHRFLRYVSPRKEDYDKKRLEEILWGDSLNGMKITISYDKQNAHLKMALTCLQAFTRSDDHTERLLPYAGEYLLHHLSKAKPKEADMDLKVELGTSLVKLFNEAHCIDKMFWTRAEYMSHPTWLETEGTWLKGNRERWLYTPSGVNEVLRWFSDPITKEYLDAGKDWVDELTKERTVGQHRKILLRGVAERLAIRLFLDKKTYTTREQLTAVYFLNGYMQIDNQEDDAPNQKDRNRMNWEEFRRIRDWATKSPKVGNENEKKSWLWKIQIARTIFTMCKYDHEATDVAEELLKEVKSLNGSPWKDSVLACQTIAQQLQLDGNYSEAREILRNITDKLSTSNKVPRNSKSDSLLAALALLDLGDLYWRKDHDSGRKDDDGGRRDHDGRRKDRAAEKYRQSLKFDATRYARYIGVLYRYRQAGLYSHIIHFVGDLSDGRNFDRVYLKRLVYDFLAKDEFRRSILSATEQKKWDEVVDSIFKKAIETAKETHVELFHISRAYGEILHQCGNPKREDDVVNQWEAALKCGQPLTTTTSDIGWPDLFSVIDPLSYIYLRRAEKALGAAKAEGKTSTISTESVKAKLDTASHWLNLIKALEQKTDIWMNATLICCIARYHTVAGDRTRAKSAVSKVIAASVGILSDDDETNDWFAYLQLGRIMEALQDKQNSKEAWNRLQSLVTPEASPSRWFLCNECEKSIPLSEGVHVYLESFALKYFHEGCYKHQGMTSGMHRVAIISPEQKLERGISLSEWKFQLQEKYVHRDDVVDVTQFTPSIPSAAASSTTPGPPPSTVVRSRPATPEDRMASVTSRGLSDDDM